MLTIRAEIKRLEKKSDGTFNVKLRFTLNRQVKRVPTSLFATKNDLTKSLSFKEGTPLKREIDTLLHSYREKCAKFQIDQNKYSLEDILDLLEIEKKKEQVIDFISFSRDWIKETTIKGAKNYTSAINSFCHFLNKDKLPITKLDRKLLNEYMAFLAEQRTQRIEQCQKDNKRIPSERASSLYIGSLRHLFKEAQKKYNDYDRNVILIPNDPFRFFVAPKQEATRKRAITPEQIKAIFALPYRKTANGNEAICRYNLAKDCFILSFCLIGMNSADLFNATEISDSAITYYRTKTKDRRLDEAKMIVKIPTIALPIINKWKDRTKNRVFNFHRDYNTESSFNRAINYGLKEIGTILGIDDLEYYAARHSWATIALNKCGIDKYTVHSALNHVDDAMKVTDIYIERDFEVENRANDMVLQFVFG